jgi:hypothetical protein
LKIIILSKNILKKLLLSKKNFKKINHVNKNLHLTIKIGSMFLFPKKYIIFESFQVKNILLTPLKHLQTNPKYPKRSTKIQNQELKIGLVVLASSTKD